MYRNENNEETPACQPASNRPVAECEWVNLPDLKGRDPVKGIRITGKLADHRAAGFAIELILCILGRMMFAAAVNCFITPLHLYSVGFTGIAQLIAAFFTGVLHMHVPDGISLTGIIFWMLNVPMLALAWFGIGKRFFYKTLFVALISSSFLTFLPVPAQPLLDNKLTLVIVAGAIAGTGAGIALSAGGSGGGQDVLGMWLAKKNPNMSVGITSLAISIFIYIILIACFDLETLIYSFIFSFVTSLAIDRSHFQNLKMRVQIALTKEGLGAFLTERMNRNAQEFAEAGTARDRRLVTVIITKAEERELIRLVRGFDPAAEISVEEGVQVFGAFRKPFS